MRMVFWFWVWGKNCGCLFLVVFNAREGGCVGLWWRGTHCGLCQALECVGAGEHFSWVLSCLYSQLLDTLCMRHFGGLALLTHEHNMLLEISYLRFYYGETLGGIKDKANSGRSPRSQEHCLPVSRSIPSFLQRKASGAQSRLHIKPHHILPAFSPYL